MPHAALWVVQRLIPSLTQIAIPSFNAARGFVGGAATASNTSMRGLSGFNAARGFVGGATLRRRYLRRRTMVFQCRTRLCGWYSNVSRVAEMARGGFNAARGYSLSPPPPLRGPPPPLTQGRLFVYGMPASLPDARDAGCCKVPSQREGATVF